MFNSNWDDVEAYLKATDKQAQAKKREERRYKIKVGIALLAVVVPGAFFYTVLICWL